MHKQACTHTRTHTQFRECLWSPLQSIQPRHIPSHSNLSTFTHRRNCPLNYLVSLGQILQKSEGDNTGDGGGGVKSAVRRKIRQPHWNETWRKTITAEGKVEKEWGHQGGGGGQIKKCGHKRRVRRKRTYWQTFDQYLVLVSNNQAQTFNRVWEEQVISWNYCGCRREDYNGNNVLVWEMKNKEPEGTSFPQWCKYFTYLLK